MKSLSSENLSTRKEATRVAAVMAVFNRKELTLRCLRSVAEQQNDTTEVTVFVVDDASPDGTAGAVACAYPDVRLLPGSGDLFWNGGMRLGFEMAMREGFDYYWWLNDDVVLDSNALSRLLDTAQAVSVRAKPGIVVGSLRDAETGRVTYGGVMLPDPLRPLRSVLVQPSCEPLPVDAMNGNCVLIPEEIACEVGNLTASYRHKMGDYDYGLRAREAGYGVWVAPGTFGICARHPVRPTNEAPLLDELRALWSVKELPFRAWFTYTRRWAGPLWPIYFVSPYLRRSFKLIAKRIRDQDQSP